MRRVLAAVAVVLLVGAVSWVLWPPLTDPARAGATTAIATGITAIAGLVAAVAAWFAAVESHRTARDASEALGLAMQPTLAVKHMSVGTQPAFQEEMTVQHYLVVTNESRWTAADLRVVARFSDGTRSAHRLDVLPAPTPDDESRRHEWRIAIDTPGPRVALRTDEDGFSHAEDVLSVEYSDERRLLRWVTETRDLQSWQSKDGINTDVYESRSRTERLR